MYEIGILKLDQPLPLAEHQWVKVVVQEKRSVAYVTSLDFLYQGLCRYGLGELVLFPFTVAFVAPSRSFVPFIECHFVADVDEGSAMRAILNGSVLVTRK